MSIWRCPNFFFIRWSEFDSGSGYNLVVLGAWEVRSREKGPNENGRPKAKATSTTHYVVVLVADSTVEVVLLQSRIVHENFAMAKVLLEATTGQPTLGCILRPRIELANFILDVVASTVIFVIVASFNKGMSINDIRQFSMFFDPPTFHVRQFLTYNQRYTYRVLQTIQMKLILLWVWAERAVLGRAKTALKFKYEI